jgi:hypothetical protein
MISDMIGDKLIALYELNKLDSNIYTINHQILITVSHIYNLNQVIFFFSYFY